MYLGFLTYEQLNISFCLKLIGMQKEEKGIPKSLKRSCPRGSLRVYFRLSNRQSPQNRDVVKSWQPTCHSLSG